MYIFGVMNNYLKNDTPKINFVAIISKYIIIKMKFQNVIQQRERAWQATTGMVEIHLVHTTTWSTEIII